MALAGEKSLGLVLWLWLRSSSKVGLNRCMVCKNVTSLGPDKKIISLLLDSCQVVLSQNDFSNRPQVYVSIPIYVLVKVRPIEEKDAQASFWDGCQRLGGVKNITINAVLCWTLRRGHPI